MKVLIVEDDLEVLRLLNKRLTSEGYHVLPVSRGTEAVAQAKTHRPDLLLIDILLPDIDGAEVVKRLRADPQIIPPIPVIFISGIVSKDETTKRTEVVVDGQVFPAVTKPFSFDALQKIIRMVLRIES